MSSRLKLKFLGNKRKIQTERIQRQNTQKKLHFLSYFRPLCHPVVYFVRIFSLKRNLIYRVDGKGHPYHCVSANLLGRTSIQKTMVSIKFWVSGKISKYTIIYVLLFKIFSMYWLNILTEERQPDFYLNSNVANV